MRTPAFLQRWFPNSSAGAGAPGIARPTVEDRLARLNSDIDRGIADARAARLSRPSRTERERFKRAQPKLVELKHAIAMQQVQF